MEQGQEAGRALDDDRVGREFFRRHLTCHGLTGGTLQLGPLIAPSIYNPVIDDVKADLHATDTQIGLSLSMYIL